MSVPHLTTPAGKAVIHILARMKTDPRLAFLLGPGTESFDLLMDAGTSMGTYDLPYQQTFLVGLKTQPVPGIGQETFEIDAEFLHRMSLLNDGVLDLEELANHFIGLGLEAEEARRDTLTEELF
jgi:hypothetical protein